MKPEVLHRRIQAELDRLSEEKIITPEARAQIGSRYVAGPVDLGVLARWFTILGAVAVAAGLAILVHDHAGKWAAIEGGQALLALALTGLGWYLGHRKAMVQTGATLELLGGMALQGLVTALAIHHSTGSKNWPALVGILCVLATVLAYALRNRLLLILAGVQAFLWFGGETGYASEWGAWWLGMTYPARFLAAGVVYLAVAWVHARFVPKSWQSFARVYLHLGLLDLHLALWFLSVFGWFDDVNRWGGDDKQRLLFTLLWAGVSVVGVVLAARTGLRVLRSYGFTFLLINLYTFYFQFVAMNSPALWFVHLLLFGGGLVAGGFFLERMLREKPLGE
jgi:hypothetical protein